MMILLGAFSLFALTFNAWTRQFEESVYSIRLVSTFLAALALCLGTIHPSQPVSFAMDMTAFAQHTNQVPAMANIELATETSSSSLLVPIQTAIPHGMAGLWGIMLFIILLLGLMGFRGVVSANFLKRLHWIPVLATCIVFVYWGVCLSTTFSPERFETYLLTFDLPPFKNVVYPDASFGFSKALASLGLASSFLTFALFIGPSLSLVRAKPRKLPEWVESGTALFVVGASLWTLNLPVTHAASNAVFIAGLLSIIVAIEDRPTVKIWLSIACLFSALTVWGTI